MTGLPADLDLRVVRRLANEPSRPDLLAAEERRLLQTFGSEKRRRAFALGREVARTLLAARLRLPPAEVALRVAADGACEVVSGALQLSIAHAATTHETLAAVGVAPFPVGVDIEVLKPRRPDLYRFLLHPADYPVMEHLPHDHNTNQIVVWALKEAVLKALRTGFRQSPKDIRLAVGQPEAPISCTAPGGRRLVARYVVGDGFVVAVAFEA